MNQPSSVDILARNGKSFNFAGVFLPKKQLVSIATLYSFCRYVDDCADELHPTEAKIEIDKIKKALDGNDEFDSKDKSIQNLISIGVQKNHMLDLIYGAEWDVSGRKIQTDKDLDLYCYHVAGVVGLMMNPLMNVQDNQAHMYAVNLGKAMQLTNICRDVLEDAVNHRTYLPLSDLTENNLELKDLQKKGPAPQALRNIVAKYLQRADEYYQTGYLGLPYIPLRCRFVILLAGELYRHIGLKIKKNNYEVLQGRTYLNVFEKTYVFFKVLPQLMTLRFWKKPVKQTTEAIV